MVIKDRLLVRSWSVKAKGWYQTFLREPRGTIQVAGLEIPVCAVRIKSERMRDTVDHAYLAKYNTASALKYAKDLARAKSRATTTELVPFLSTHLDPYELLPVYRQSGSWPIVVYASVACQWRAGKWRSYLLSAAKRSSLHHRRRRSAQSPPGAGHTKPNRSCRR